MKIINGEPVHFDPGVTMGAEFLEYGPTEYERFIAAPGASEESSERELLRRVSGHVEEAIYAQGNASGAAHDTEAANDMSAALTRNQG